MGWESTYVVKFDLRPSFKVKRVQSNLKVHTTCLLLVLEVWDVKPTYRKSWAGNLRMWSDLTLVPSLKVKRWFTGFGELSFGWIQICIGSLMRRASVYYQIQVMPFYQDKQLRKYLVLL